MSEFSNALPNAWHKYEDSATESALRERCEENGFLLVR